MSESDQCLRPSSQLLGADRVGYNFRLLAFTGLVLFLTVAKNGTIVARDISSVTMSASTVFSVEDDIVQSTLKRDQRSLEKHRSFLSGYIMGLAISKSGIEDTSCSKAIFPLIRVAAGVIDVLQYKEEAASSVLKPVIDAALAGVRRSAAEYDSLATDCENLLTRADRRRSLVTRLKDVF